MARFQFDAVPEVAPTGAPGNDYEHIPTSPEMFGGSIAGAEGTLGRGIEKTADTTMSYLQAKQEVNNEVHSNDKLSWAAGQGMDKSEKFLQLEGKAASMALPQFNQDLVDLRNKTLEGESPAVQATLSRGLASLFDRYQLYATEHAATQERSWHDKVATDSAATFGNQAVLDSQHGTWDHVDQSLFKSDDEITKLWEQRNSSADPESKAVIDSEVAKNRGANVKRLVETLSDTDPRTAQAVFDRYKSGMDAGSVLAVTSHLKSVNAQLEGRQVADEETGRAPRGGPPTPVADMPASFIGASRAEEGFDPKPRWDVNHWTVGYGTRASGPDEQVDQAGLEKRFQSSVSDAAKIVDGVNPKLDPGTRAALISLTFNAGDAWTRSGLGAQVKASDIDGAQKSFLQYANVAGEPNQAIAERRWREAQWFGQAEAPAGGPALDKAHVFDRILARTDGNPLTQNAAVARMNLIYSVEHAQNTQAQVSFEQRVKDTTTEAYNAGTAATPLTENDFVQKRGFAQGRAEYAQYKDNLALGADVAAAANMAPGDILARWCSGTRRSREHLAMPLSCSASSSSRPN